MLIKYSFQETVRLWSRRMHVVLMEYITWQDKQVGRNRLRLANNTDKLISYNYLVAFLA
jgi:hypothetical protein